MKRILVFSDSHGYLDHIREILKKEQPDMIIHLGDCVRDVYELQREFPEHTIEYVKGNCDIFSSDKSLPENLLLHLDEYTVMMTHGHLFGTTPTDFEKAAAYAAENGADVLLFGHTHFPIEKYLPEGTLLCGNPLKKPLYVFNPGCLGRIAEGVGGHYYFGTMRTSKSGIIFAHGKI